jgi:channel protein (hemolysin III family)
MDVYGIPGFREPFNCFSHFVAATIFGIAAFRLIRRGRGHRGRVAVLSLFAAASVSMLSISGVYHMLGENGSPRAVMLRVDYAAIFVLIAATFSACHMILFRGQERWGPLIVIWTLAIIGIAFKTIFADQIPMWMGVSMYLGMGWLGSFSAIRLWHEHGFAFVATLLYGAVAYTVGALLLWQEQPTIIRGVIGPHEVWHLAVILGLGFHWQFIYRIADDETPR